MFTLTVLATLALVTSAYNTTHNSRCGHGFDLSCPTDYCCSRAGYCGKGPQYCSVPGNCQEDFGWCDSFVVPDGPPRVITHKPEPKKYHNFDSVVKECTVPNTLALTFDDGPSQYTEEILDILQEFNAKATFFVGGIINGRGQIDKFWTPTLRRMVTQGHQIGSHTWAHPNLDALNTTSRYYDIRRNDRAIANAIGKTPTFIRPPMIKCTTEECRRDMADLGYTIAHYDVDSQD